MKQKLKLIPDNAAFISGALSQLTGNLFVPRVDTPNSLLQYAYCFGDIDYIDNNVEGPNHKQLVIKSIVEDSGKDVREYAIAKWLGLYSNMEQNGIDAYKITYDEKTNTFKIVYTFELKSESLRKCKTSPTGYKKLSGNFSISSKLIKHKETVDTWINKNDKIAVSGWIDGHVAYILSFTTKKSGVREHILNRLAANAKLTEGGISFTYKHFIDATDLTLEYVNTDLCTYDNITEPLFIKIMHLRQKTKKTTIKSNRVLKPTMLEKYVDIVKLLDSNLTVVEIVAQTNKSTSTVNRVKKLVKDLEISK